MIAQHVVWEISIVGLSISFFALISVLIRPKKYKADIYFCFWLFLLITPMIHAIVNQVSSSTLFFREYLNISLNLLNGPILYFYTRVLIRNTLEVRWHHLLHLIPFGFYYILFIKSSFPLPLLPSPETWLPQLKPVHLPPPIGGNGYFSPLLNVLMKSFGLVNAALFLVYSFFTIAVLNKHRQKISQYYSHNNNRINLKWIYALPSLFAALVCINLLNERMADPLPTIYPHSLHLFSYLLFILLLCFFGVKQTPVFNNHKVVSGQKNAEASIAAFRNSPENLNMDDSVEAEHSLQPEESIDDQSMRELIERIRGYMENEKPYLEPTFTVYELSQALDIPRRTLSHTLSHGLSKNFFQYINEYRVEEVKVWLRNDTDKQTTLLDIAFASGFNSKTTFNCFFKQHCGITPSQYRKRLIQDKTT